MDTSIQQPNRHFSKLANARLQLDELASSYLFMHVPCWNLPRLHRAVRATQPGERTEVAAGYVSVLRETTRRPADLTRV